MKRLSIASVALLALLAGGAVRVVQDQCGPFTDVTPAFCPYILELYYLGVTAGTSATTFSPDDPLTRGQGSVFVAKGLNQALARSSRRAALGQWWTTTPHWDLGLGVTTLGSSPRWVACDGSDIWVGGENPGAGVARVRGSDGKLIENHSAMNPQDIVIAMGRVFAVVETAPFTGGLYSIDPSQPDSEAVLVGQTDAGAGDPEGLAFDGSKFWIGLNGNSMWTFTPSPSLPWTGQAVPVGSFYNPIFDGTFIWAAGGPSLVRISSDGSTKLTVPVPATVQRLVFDGANVWATTTSPDSVVVVSAGGTIVANLTGNGLFLPGALAFDGQRILVTNANDSISLWTAADLTPLGSVQTGAGTNPSSVCSDGVNFWVALRGSGQLARF
ncbi:MAG TPA: S-layer homology domain-containing protein [Thermoanaerobaculia bacterium]|jgi:hypothetical protein